MIPVIALIGRYNVGKSTLFNKLTRTNDALVADFSGLTRDRKYGQAEFAGQKFIIIDTGGINISKDEIEMYVVYQSLIAIEEADIIFFIVDIRSGLMPVDYEIAKHLRNCKKNTYLLANKIDGVNINTVLDDFYALGIKDIHYISTLYGRGIVKLFKKIVSSFSLGKSFKDIQLSEDKDNTASWKINADILKIKNNKESVFNPFLLPIKLAIVGKPNVGKSTLINCIFGDNRVIVCKHPGTTRDSIYIQMERDGLKYVLIDTAGIRKKRKIINYIEKLSIIKTLESIKYANIVLLVIDAQEGISDQDLSVLRFILNVGRSLVIVINKWDSISANKRKLVKNMLNLRLRFIDFCVIHFISALHGSGISQLWGSINEIYNSATRRVNTALLTRILKMAEEEYEPPLIRGRRVKMKYAHAGGYNPPIVVIHGNQVANLPNFYKRYLINYFGRKLHIIGTPIHIQFKNGINPYINKT